MKRVDACATTTTERKVAKMRAEPKSIGIQAQTYLLGYEVAAVWLINSAFYPSRVMPGGSVVTTLTQKRAVFPAFSFHEVTLVQMCKIYIPFIIYPNFVVLCLPNGSCQTA